MHSRLADFSMPSKADFYVVYQPASHPPLAAGSYQTPGTSYAMDRWLQEGPHKEPWNMLEKGVKSVVLPQGTEKTKLGPRL
jgi:hypothetical protein